MAITLVPKLQSGSSAKKLLHHGCPTWETVISWIGYS